MIGDFGGLSGATILLRFKLKTFFTVEADRTGVFAAGSVGDDGVGIWEGNSSSSGKRSSITTSFLPDRWTLTFSSSDSEEKTASDSESDWWTNDGDTPFLFISSTTNRLKIGKSFGEIPKSCSRQISQELIIRLTRCVLFLTTVRRARACKTCIFPVTFGKMRTGSGIGKLALA